MAKEGHKHKTVVMSLEIEDRLIEYVQKMNKEERALQIPKRQQTDASSVISRALEEYFDNHAG